MSFAVRPIYKTKPSIVREPPTGEYFDGLAPNEYYWHFEGTDYLLIYWNGTIIHDGFNNNITSYDAGDGWIYYRGSLAFNSNDYAYGYYIYRILKSSM